MMDQLMEIMGMRIQAVGSLPPGTMLIVSPDQMYKLMMDPRVSDHLVHRYVPPPMVYPEPDLTRWKVQYGAGYQDRPAIQALSLLDWVDDNGFAGLMDAMVHERARLERESRITVAMMDMAWDREWWHDGRQKGWWES